MPTPYRDMTPEQRWARTSKGFRKLRQTMWTQGNRTCWLCGKPITDQADYTIDHVVPLNQGGDNNPNNLRPAHGKKRPDCPGNYGRQDKPISEKKSSRTW